MASFLVTLDLLDYWRGFILANSCNFSSNHLQHAIPHNFYTFFIMLLGFTFAAKKYAMANWKKILGGDNLR